MTETASAIGRPADGTVTRNILPRGLIILLGLASLVVVLAGARSIAWLIGPVFLALILVIALAPVQTWMRRRGWPGWLSTRVLILLVYAVLLVMIASIVVSIARLATEMPQYANQAQHYVTAATNLLAKYGIGPEQLQSLAGQLNWARSNSRHPPRRISASPPASFLSRCRCPQRGTSGIARTAHRRAPAGVRGPSPFAVAN
jgi:predicted PurR-regulated permease PerM